MKTENVRHTGKPGFKENFQRAKPMLLAWFIIASIYCLLYFHRIDSDMILTPLLAVLFLFVSVFSIVAFFPQLLFLSLYLCIGSQSAIFFSSWYYHDLEFYFYGLFVLALCVSTLRNFRVMFICILYLTISTGLITIFITPGLEWVDNYRFFIKLVLFVFSSASVLLHIRNIEQKESTAERALQAFSSLLRSTPNFMLITDAANKVLYISDPMLKFAHYARREFAAGQPLIDLFHDKKLKIMFADILDTDGYFETVVQIDIGGEEHHYKIVADKLMGSSGGKFVDITDITPLVKSRHIAEEAQQRAEIANSSKSKFLAATSHEIRTPLNAIIGISEIELNREATPPATKEALDKIYNASYTLLSIINNILDLSKIETGKFELLPVRYDIPSIINDTITLNLMRIASKNIEFKLKVSENMPDQLIGDELRIRQVMNNLLSNAFKYTNEGSVTMEIAGESMVDPETGEEIFNLVINIRDTGQGMTQDQVGRIFDEYTRFNAMTNRSTEGTGLGMSITKNFVEMMHGTISVESVVGMGTTFIVRIPQERAGSGVLGSDMVQSLQSFRYFEESQTKNAQVVREYMPYGRVLIVDDVETNLYVAKGLMSPYGLHIETAGSGFETLDMIQAGKIYDIVFMDHMMPGMDGIETTKRIREAGYTAPIVALTANAIIGQAEIFMQNGFDDFISKPIDFRQLNAVLNRLVRDKQPPEVIEDARKQKDIAAASGTVSLEADTALLEIFSREAKKALQLFEDVLRNGAAEGDLHALTIKAHAMKSALANIGESAASALALSLEEAGRARNLPMIEPVAQCLMSVLRSLVARIDANTESAFANTDEAPDVLLAKLKIIRDSCLDFDLDAADAAMQELEEMSWTRETRALLAQIAEHLLHSEFEEAAMAAQSWMQSVPRSAHLP